MLLTAGQAGDNPQLFALLDAIRVHEGGPGRPRKKPDMLIADKAYAHDPTRELRRRGIAHTIPERVDQLARRAAKGSHGGRPPSFDKAGLPAAKRRGTPLQPVEAMASAGHPLRQNAPPSTGQVCC
ncbi:hypothetical protein KRM28CT15_17510 [Krasilnikovia sp. M28-CT-15]